MLRPLRRRPPENGRDGPPWPSHFPFFRRRLIRVRGSPNPPATMRSGETSSSWPSQGPRRFGDRLSLGLQSRRLQRGSLPNCLQCASPTVSQTNCEILIGPFPTRHPPYTEIRPLGRSRYRWRVRVGPAVQPYLFFRWAGQGARRIHPLSPTVSQTNCEILIGSFPTRHPPYPKIRPLGRFPLSRESQGRPSGPTLPFFSLGRARGPPNPPAIMRHTMGKR